MASERVVAGREAMPVAVLGASGKVRKILDSTRGIASRLLFVVFGAVTFILTLYGVQENVHTPRKHYILSRLAFAAALAYYGHKVLVARKNTPHQRQYTVQHHSKKYLAHKRRYRQPPRSHQSRRKQTDACSHNRPDGGAVTFTTNRLMFAGFLTHRHCKINPDRGTIIICWQKGAEMTSAVDVAAYILEQVGNITTMKLQKLVYYTQVRYLVTHNVPLFSNRIEAWANGPVIPDLFRIHAGKYMIDQGDLGSAGSPSALSQPQRMAANKVIELFGTYSGEQLREITHKEAPWVDARKGCKPGDRCEAEITTEAMHSYYSSPRCNNPIAR